MNTTLLIDLSNLTCHSYYAQAMHGDEHLSLEDLEAGLERFVSRLLEEVNPHNAQAALDSPNNWRKTLYPPYKAHRKPKPEKLEQLFTVAPALFARAGVSLWHSPTFEADDVLASLADARLVEGGRTLIATSDTDLWGCVLEGADGSGTFVLKRKPGMWTRIGPAQVRGKFGVSPERLSFYKSLTGDPSDGYPGIPGIGPVAARRLTGEYRTMKGLFNALETLPKAERIKIERTGLEQSLLMERLASPRLECMPLPFCHQTVTKPLTI